ncbi:MAG: competence/damage-inducible protein A [Ignavibacteriae bacterium]|nr:competence/damage-inducible protein A [Ignavibacteria bacterium]MBI3363989.1 competence/damage-inducible protein A [Ignavibacteriota bacterium]
MKSIIITIGDELLIGQVINTNAAYIAGKLNSAGIEVRRVLTIGDEHHEILAALEESYPKFDVIVITGGLGPTHDDVTKKAVCTFFHTDLISSPDARKNIEQFLKSRSHSWSDAAEEQTHVPRGSTIIPNKLGTASGILFEREGKHVIVMPGVPYEMEGMMEDFIVPYFTERNTGKVVLHRTLKTTGIPESMLAAKLGDLKDLLGKATLAFLPSPSGVRMRITVVDPNRSAAETLIRDIESRIREKVEKYIYGADNEELEEIVGRVLAERKLTIAVAESCTGGLIADRITNVPGSSNYFERGIVAYSNESKIRLLDVPEKLIEKYGAVSKDVAEAMARGIREAARVDIGLSTTGIAGPSGGSAEKPVGTVWIGYSYKNETRAVKFQFGTERLRIKERAAQAALELVRRKILRIE